MAGRYIGLSNGHIHQRPRDFDPGHVEGAQLVKPGEEALGLPPLLAPEALAAIATRAKASKATAGPSRDRAALLLHVEALEALLAEVDGIVTQLDINERWSPREGWQKERKAERREQARQALYRLMRHRPVIELLAHVRARNAASTIEGACMTLMVADKPWAMEAATYLRAAIKAERAGIAKAEGKKS